MKVVKVTYTAKAEFSEKNQLNIKKVMNDLQQLSDPGILYHTCMMADDKSFIHTAFFKSEEGETILFALPSFKAFQEQLKASMPEIPPKQELLTLVGSSKDIFNF